MDWTADEYSSINLGYSRLNKRAKKLFKQFSDTPMSECIPVNARMTLIF